MHTRELNAAQKELIIWTLKGVTCKAARKTVIECLANAFDCSEELIEAYLDEKKEVHRSRPLILCKNG